MSRPLAHAHASVSAGDLASWGFANRAGPFLCARAPGPRPKFTRTKTPRARPQSPGQASRRAIRFRACDLWPTGSKRPGAGDRVRAIRPICLTPAESRFVWRVPEQIRFVWHAKRKKAGIRHAKRNNLGIRPRQARKGGISATQSAKRQEFGYTKRQTHDGPHVKLAFTGERPRDISSWRKRTPNMGPTFLRDNRADIVQ